MNMEWTEETNQDPEGSTRNLQEIHFAKCSPLGLTLKKTQSFKSLLETELSTPQQPVVQIFDDNNNNNIEARARTDNLGDQHLIEKVKASNFPMTSLKIGAWQRNSMYAGDLIAKLYYAKKKLVWEILDGALDLQSKLKSKIEIVWSDITAIQAIIPDGQPGILNIQLNKRPMFFREIGPEPKKHTTWLETADFTNGEAQISRLHCVSFPPNVLDKHYENLLQCDRKLFQLSREKFPSHECPYFQPRVDMADFGSVFPPLVQQYPCSADNPAPPLAPLVRQHPHATTDPAVAPLVRQHPCSTDNLTMPGALFVRAPPNPVMSFPNINHERPIDYQYITAQRQPYHPISWHQGMDYFPRGNIDTSQPGPSSVFASPTSGDQINFTGGNNYQPSRTFTLGEIEEHLGINDSETGDANPHVQMVYPNNVANTNPVTHDARCVSL